MLISGQIMTNRGGSDSTELYCNCLYQEILYLYCIIVGNLNPFSKVQLKLGSISNAAFLSNLFGSKITKTKITSLFGEAQEDQKLFLKGVVFRSIEPWWGIVDAVKENKPTARLYDSKYVISTAQGGWGWPCHYRFGLDGFRAFSFISLGLLHYIIYNFQRANSKIQMSPISTHPHRGGRVFWLFYANK